MATVLLLCVFSFYFSWWRRRGRFLRSLLSAEWTRLSSRPLSVRIIWLSPHPSPCKVEWSFKYIQYIPWQAKKLDVAAGPHWLREVIYACRGEGMFAMSKNNFGKRVGGLFVILCAQTNKNIHWNICETYSGTLAGCTHANTLAYGLAAASVFLKFLSVLPPPSSLQPSLSHSDWQLGRRRERRREVEREDGGPE